MCNQMSELINDEEFDNFLCPKCKFYSLKVLGSNMNILGYIMELLYEHE